MHVSNQKNIFKGCRRAFDGFLEFTLPSRCPGCSQKIQAHGFLCPACWADLVPLAEPYCRVCAVPFEFDAGDESEENVCGACLQCMPAFDWARSAVLYENLGRSLVLRLKHGGSTAYVPAMARMMVQALRGIEADVVMPVPLHTRRMLKRRFNQSQLLAQAVAKELSLPLDTFSLAKKKATRSQGGLNRSERFRNVQGSFALGKGAGFSGKSVILIDDVLTTGATAEACAKVLKRAGAAEVGILTFARVGKPVSG